MGVGCPCPPVRNNIVTPRHLLDFIGHCLYVFLCSANSVLDYTAGVKETI